MTMRSYYCKDIARCIERFDHYCPWVDNAIGIGNQRIFYIFLINTTMLICSFFMLLFAFFRAEKVRAVAAGASWLDIEDIAVEEEGSMDGTGHHPSSSNSSTDSSNSSTSSSSHYLPIFLFLSKNIIATFFLCLNFAALAFCVLMLARHGAFMANNVTVFETISPKPLAHVNRRFGPARNRMNSYFWMLRDCGVWKTVRSCYGYWRPSMYWDEQDFMVGKK